MKTETQSERSELARRASMARKSFKGGRPRLHDQPSQSLKVDRKDLDVLRGYARLKGITVVEAVHRLCALLVLGGKGEAHPGLAPDGWVC